MTDWRPAHLDSLEEKWAHLRIRSGITAAEAERLMLDYLAMREDWLDAYVKAVYYEDIATWKYESAYNLVFLRAEAKTDAARATIAKSDSVVRAAKLSQIEAHAAMIRAKMKVEGAVLAHHALKKIFEESSQERRFL